jgi:hypothetical protein
LAPAAVASEVVVPMELHIRNHPSKALPIVVVPGAETTSFLWPKVNHLSGHVSWISNGGRNTECNAHHDELTVFITHVVVSPEQEELILEENVNVDIH